MRGSDRAGGRMHAMSAAFPIAENVTSAHLSLTLATIRDVQHQIPQYLLESDVSRLSAANVICRLDTDCHQLLDAPHVEG